MSILLAERLPSTNPSITSAVSPTTASTSQPASVAAPTTTPVEHPMMLGLVLSWAVIGLAAAGLLGAFRPKSILGPQRLGERESGWDFFFVGLIAFTAGFVADVILLSIFRPAPGVKMLLLQAGVDLSTFVAGIVLLKRLRPGALASIGLDFERLSTGIAGGATTLFVLYPLIQITSIGVEKIFDRFQIPQAKPHEILQLLGKSQDHRLTTFAIVLAVVIAPFTEELIYRGFLQTSLTRLFSWLKNPTPAEVLVPEPTIGVRWAAILVTSTLFAAVHIEPAFLAPIFVLAVGLGYVYERTGSLWVTITAHALFNTAQITLFLASGR